MTRRETANLSHPASSMPGKTSPVPDSLPQTEAFFLEKSAQGRADIHHHILPLTNSIFQPGHVMEFINNMPNADQKALALAECHFFQGKASAASAESSKLLRHSDPMLRLSANLIYGLSNLSLGYTPMALQALRQIDSIVQFVLDQQQEPNDPQEQQQAYLFGQLINSLMRRPNTLEMPFTLSQDPELNGFRVIVIYSVAYQVALSGEAERALGMIESVLAYSQEQYVIPRIYSYLMMAISFINLNRIEEAKEAFMKAWEIAKPDMLLHPFAQHHSLLCGLVEVCLKSDEPQMYRRITAMSYVFGASWRQMHHGSADDDLVSSLTAMEYSIAMLAAKKWKVREIAGYMKISEGYTKKMLSGIYIKLGVSSRDEMLSSWFSNTEKNEHDGQGAVFLFLGIRFL